MIGMRGEGGKRDLRAIDEEVRFHIEGRVEELMAEGLSREEARRRAMDAFGDVDRVRADLADIGAERARKRRRGELAHGVVRDFRVGTRRLLRSPGYALVALSTLALGVAASVAMFTVVNAVVLRPLPYPEPDRLVRLWPSTSMNISLSREIAERMPSVRSATGISHWGLTLTGEGSADVLDAAVVDAGYFEVFGVRPTLGRPFTPEETVPGRSDVVLLGYDTWRSRFGADPGVVGRRIQLSEYGHTSREVIGVMPAGHQTLDQESDVWVPLALPAGTGFLADSTWYLHELVARLAPGATVERASSEVRSLADRLRNEYTGRFEDDAVASASVVGLLDSVVGDSGRMLWTLLAAVGLVLLIACGNLANLLLARGSGRRRELAVQAAMGASRSRLVVQQLAESAIVAVLGGGMGLLLAIALLDVVRVAEASGLPRVAGLAVDGRVLVFALGITACSLLAFGLLPALRATRPGLRDDLASGGRGTGVARGAHRLNRVLVGGQIAMATTLSIAAALVLSSFARLSSVDPGIDTSDVVAIEILPPADRYSGEGYVTYYRNLLERLRALPGLTSLGGIHILPFTLRNWSFPYLAEGQTPNADEPLPSANFRMVTPGYFAAVDQPLVAGRDVADTDLEGSPRVLLVNRSFAEMLWPGQDAVGRELRVYGSLPHRVVGVVGDVHQFALDRPVEPEMYVPLAQWTRGGSYMHLVLEAPRAPELVPAARHIIEQVDPNVPVTGVRSLDDALGETLARRRFIMLVLVTFGGLALVLGGIGVYGVMSHLVGARLPDFGLRMALGASPGGVLREALRSGLAPAVAGLVAGLLAALAAARVITSLLYDVRAVDLATCATVAALLLGVATLASWLPARRAARADPLTVLRAD